MVRYAYLICLIFLIPEISRAQIKEPTQKTNPIPTTSSTDSKVFITWNGPGSVKIFLDNKEVFIGEGQEKSISIIADKAYTIKAQKPEKTFSYHDFVIFQKGVSYYLMRLKGDELVIEKTLSPQEKATVQEATLRLIISEIESNMITVTGGSFMMGCTKEQTGKGDWDCDENEMPIHSVTISDFRMSKYELTQAQWMAVMGSNPSAFNGCDKCPVESISWNEVQEFIRKLNEITGLRFRLPTEAEWEFAARGGTKSKGYRYSGSNNLDDVGWAGEYCENKTYLVGQKLPNEIGLFDMTGNVGECCSDWYQDNYYFLGEQVDPTGPEEGYYRIVRGGSFRVNDWGSRLSNRGLVSPSDRYPVYGFRLAQSP